MSGFGPRHHLFVHKEFPAKPQRRRIGARSVLGLASSAFAPWKGLVSFFVILFPNNQMIRIEDIVEKVAANHAQADLDLLRRAYLFSAKEHKGQKRASGESYLVHPLEVANILADMKLDEVSVATGLLHDVVEDTLVDLDTIRRYFG